MLQYNICICTCLQPCWAEVLSAQGCVSGDAINLCHNSETTEKHNSCFSASMDLRKICPLQFNPICLSIVRKLARSEASNEKPVTPLPKV